MNEPTLSLADLQNEIKALKTENQQLGAAVLLLEQLMAAFFTPDLGFAERDALIHSINDNFTALGEADTIPLSPTPSRTSTALKVAMKLHQISSLSEMVSDKRD